ncbi:hypothetical protein D0C36_20725 [Mucilaginibacter conchicola]|uniref:Haem-binding domain-containing protein n=1 Tax=Mucilaginibacter conchicola TaxID=2303333 RepID=A0A372NMR5_9SPHI|nr:heme-binding domain-containing protein [Mucilaginibacter conchicola]RFZ90226.1 hypothetical protein D0C36_20725 [Mucilaginibacter conchicola]
MKRTKLNPIQRMIVIIGVAMIIFVPLQFSSPDLGNPATKKEISLPTEVKAILERACYDCHSNRSQPEWFDRIAPVSYMVGHDIKEARSRLNLSEWDRNPPAVQQLLLWEMVNAIEEKKMPLPRYLTIHPNAAVSPAELAVLKQYVNTLPGRNMTDTSPIVRSDSNKRMPLVPVALNGIHYFSDFKTWRIISTTDKYDGGSMRVVYGNDLMVQAIKSKKLPFPDGAKIVKVVWGKQHEDKDGNILPGNFQNVQIMIKDRKKYRSTEGWGFAKFDGLKLKPFGKSVAFATTCINCHRLLVSESDFVFNIPTK